MTRQLDGGSPRVCTGSARTVLESRRQRREVVNSAVGADSCSVLLGCAGDNASKKLRPAKRTSEQPRSH